MIPQIEKSVIESNIDRSKSIRMQIDPNSYMFQVMYKQIYSRPAWSVCREIITNGIDAHKSIGKEHIPITIIEGDPFVVIDEGPGISLETMQEVVGFYGRSTKRDSNNQEGMFGLGVKSPWSITDQFTIETVIERDGKHLKQIYILSKNEIGSGEILPLFRDEDGNYCYVETDEPTGTKVKIPVQTAHKQEIHNSIVAHCNFLPTRPTVAWEKGTVAWVDPLEVNDDWFIYDWTKLQTLIPGPYNTIYNGIPYQINGVYGIEDFFFRLKTGDIELNASREQVVNLYSTKSKLETVYNRYKEESKKKLENALAICNNVEEVLETFRTNSVYIKFFNEWSMTFNYKGAKVSLINGQAKSIKRNSSYYKTKLNTYGHDVNISSLKKEQIIILDHKDKLANTTIRRKIIQYMDTNGYKELAILFQWEDAEGTTPIVYDTFFEELKAFAYDITLVKLTYKKQPKGTPKSKQSYTIQTGSSKWDKIVVNDLTDKDYIYKMVDKGHSIDYNSYPKKPNSDVIRTVIRKDSRLHKKIQSLPNWFTVEEYYQKYVDKHKLTKEEIDNLIIEAASRGWSTLARRMIQIDPIHQKIVKDKSHLEMIQYGINNDILEEPNEYKIKQEAIKKYPLLKDIYETASNKNAIEDYIRLIDQDEEARKKSLLNPLNKETVNVK